MSQVGSSGAYSYRQLMQLWVAAGGNKALAPIMAAIAMAESGGNPRARNPSGASGLWQILGNPFPGNAFDPMTNARMAVAKYHEQGLKAWTTYTSGDYKKFLQGTNPTPPVTAGKAFVDEAEKFFGAPYVWGGESPKGFDCSGLVQYVAQKLGLKNMPRTSEAQWSYVHHIPRSELKPGDLVFYAGSDGTTASPGHVAIYQGGGKIIQAEETGTNVGSFPIDSAGTPVGYGRIPGINSATFHGTAPGGSGGGSGGGGDWSQWTSDFTGALRDVTDFSSFGNLFSSLLGALPGQTTGPAGPLAAIGETLLQFEHHIAWFFVPNHWVRIMCGLVGVPLVGLGVVTMTRTGRSYSVTVPVANQTVPAPGGELAPALGIAEVTVGAILLFVAFHNLEAQGVNDWGSLLSYFQTALHTQGATSGGGG